MKTDKILTEILQDDEDFVNAAMNADDIVGKNQTVRIIQKQVKRKMELQ